MSFAVSLTRWIKLQEQILSTYFKVWVVEILKSISVYLDSKDMLPPWIGGRVYNTLMLLQGTTYLTMHNLSGREL